jgi:hypothetical protein
MNKVRRCARRHIMTTPKTSTAASPAKPPTVKPPPIDARPFLEAKERASRHRAELEASGRCACFFCFKKFATSEIKAWVDGNQTALCPHCGLDSVLGSGTEHRIDDTFLRRMHQYYYAYRTK